MRIHGKIPRAFIRSLRLSVFVAKLIRKTPSKLHLKNFLLGSLKSYFCIMKKILLLSDTHSHIDDTILKYVKLADEVWHAGDIGDLKVTDTIQKLKPLRAVFGNIDNHEARLEFPLNNRFFCEGVEVLITHIGGYPGRYSPAIKEEITKNPPKLFISGHSHILKVMFDKKYNCLHMNPGAAGISGFHQKRTMLRFEIDGDKIQSLEVIEIGDK